MSGKILVNEFDSMFPGQIMADGKDLVELAQLHGIRPQRLREAAKSVNDHAIDLETMFSQAIVDHI